MELIPVCLDNLRTAVGDFPRYSGLCELDPDGLARCLTSVAETNYTVAPGNAHRCISLLFNLDRLRDPVRRAFLERLFADMARLAENLPRPLTRHPEAADKVHESSQAAAEDKNEPPPAAVADRPWILPMPNHGQSDWFDRLLDLAVMLVKGLGLVR